MEARKLHTYDDLLQVPDHLVAELIDGRLHTSPRPAPRHARASSRLGMVLGPPWDLGSAGPGGWRILDEPELHLGPDVLVPDLAGWRRTRLPTLPDTAYFALRPDWICEVLSPGNERFDRLVKMDRYAEAGVPWAWLVQPTARYIEVYKLREGHWTRTQTAHDETEASLAPFTAVPFDVNALWEP